MSEEWLPGGVMAGGDAPFPAEDWRPNWKLILSTPTLRLLGTPEELQPICCVGLSQFEARG